MTLNCIAVDDEPLALKLVCTFIEQTPFLNLIGRYGKAVEALRALSQHPEIDVVFLDIQMPDLNGLELARLLDKGPNSRGPRVIFTTAYNQFAVEGFRVDALDYLLKPFNYEEFLRAATKAKSYVELTQASGALPPTPTPDDHIYLKVEYQLVRVEYNDILYVEGLKDYLKVYRRSEPRPLLSLSTLKTLEERLPSSQFMRVHRSYIISLRHITSITRGTVQIGDMTIPVSDRYREQFDQFFSKWK